MKAHNPMHPGQFIQEVFLDELGLTKAEAARHLAVTLHIFATDKRKQWCLTGDGAKIIDCIRTRARKLA
jgi:hypothetical protein